MNLPTSWSDLSNRQDVLVGRKQLLGVLAMWAVRQSPYPCPDNLHVVLQKLDVIWKARTWGLLDFTQFRTLRHLENWLKEVLTRMPEFMAWNERKNGDQSSLNFISRHDGRMDPDSDFIDLDALVRNVAMEVWRESVHNRLQDH